MDDLVDILVPIAGGCVLPIMIVWLVIRKSMNETIANIARLNREMIKAKLSD